MCSFNSIHHISPRATSHRPLNNLQEVFSKAKNIKPCLELQEVVKHLPWPMLFKMCNGQRWYLHITKHLVAQLYGEFRQFFPDNSVGYFVSYYDYYQPEAYMPVSDTYIEKDLSINEELDKLRLAGNVAIINRTKRYYCCGQRELYLWYR